MLQCTIIFVLNYGFSHYMHLVAFMIEPAQLDSDLTRFKEYPCPAEAQFVLWIMSTYQDQLLSVCRVSPIYQWSHVNSCLLSSASLCGATPTNRV